LPDAPAPTCAPPRRPISPPRTLPGAGTGTRWGLSIAATALSTYALDAVATLAGTALVASGLLAGAATPAAAAFLAASYLAWGLGLRENLRANWLLLTATGTSTNVLSKLAHDLVEARGGRARWQRLAADAGYAGSELAKELPYYVAAIAASGFTDYISAADAMVFLGGANLGAAAYEYALARGTRAALRGTLAAAHRNGPTG
jgi:hypothetical protein